MTLTIAVYFYFYDVLFQLLCIFDKANKYSKYSLKSVSTIELFVCVSNA